MKLTKKLCSLVGIYNPMDYSLGNVYIDYHPSQTGRMALSSRWIVVKRGHKFQGHWMDFGNKVFSIWGKAEKSAKFDEAVKFVRDFLQAEVEMVKTPMGSFMEKSFVEMRNAQIVEMVKAKKNENSGM